MITSPALHHTAIKDGGATGHFCPVCLRRVSPAAAERRTHREACRSGDLDVSLLLCPTCGVTLAAEVDAAYLGGTHPHAA